MGARRAKRGPAETSQRIANLRKGLNEFGEPLNEEEDQKRKDLLDRNREAARRCRSKRKNLQADLEAEGQRLIDSNEELHELVAELRAEVQVLRECVQGHGQQACPAGGMSKDALAFLSRPLPAVSRRQIPSSYLTMPVAREEDAASSASSPTVTRSVSGDIEMQQSRRDIPVGHDIPVGALESPPILSATPLARNVEAPRSATTPLIDPALLGDHFANNDFAFSFFHHGQGTPGGQNVDLSSLLRTSAA